MEATEGASNTVHRGRLICVRSNIFATIFIVNSEWPSNEHCKMNQHEDSNRSSPIVSVTGP